MAEKKQQPNEMVFIQSRLNAPKNQRNNFGKYNYRSCEDILEALKPLLSETNCTLTVSDDIVEIGGRIYVKATATLTTADGVVYTTTAFAREADTKTGMDVSQITGAASSYARKYALNGLFCIDDNKDADALNTNEKFTQPAKTEKKASKTTQSTQAPTQTQMFDDGLQEAFELIKANIESAPSQQYLMDLHKQNPALHDFAPYKQAMNKRFKEVQ